MTKERLRRYVEIKKEVRQIRDQLEEIESRLYSPKGQLLTGMPSAPSHEGGTITESLMDKHEQLLQMYREQLTIRYEEQLAIEKAIASLEDPTARRLMRYRYLDGLKWEEICVLINYEWSRTHEIHGMALKQLKAQEEAGQ